MSKLADVIHTNCPMIDSEDEEAMKASIIELMKSLVPAESMSDCVCDRAVCYNDCRQQILYNIEKL